MKLQQCLNKHTRSHLAVMSLMICVLLRPPGLFRWSVWSRSLSRERGEWCRNNPHHLDTHQRRGVSTSRVARYVNKCVISCDWSQLCSLPSCHFVFHLIYCVFVKFVVLVVFHGSECVSVWFTSAAHLQYTVCFWVQVTRTNPSCTESPRGRISICRLRSSAGPSLRSYSSFSTNWESQTGRGREENTPYLTGRETDHQNTVFTF